MQPPHQPSRINLAELKAQIVKKLGPDGSKQYFHYLNRLLSLKISKTEFNKLCVRILGRDNIPLHNQFIRSILRNACCAKVPPPRNSNEVLVQATAIGNKAPPSDAIGQNGPHVATNQASYQPGLSNGDILPSSPRKVSKSFHDHRTADNHRAFGPSGKANSTLPQPTTTVSSDFNMIENGDYSTPDLHGAVQHHQGLMQRTEQAHDPAKSSVIKIPQDIPVSVHNKDQFRDDQEEIHARSLLQAPLGVPLCMVSVGGARRTPLATSSKCVSTSSCGALLDSITLRERMNQIAKEHGLEGVPMDCANLLNNGLDSYLKGLIRSCVQLIGARSGHGTMKNNAVKHQAYSKPVNGIRPGHHHHLQLSTSKPSELSQEQLPHSRISLQDFRIAMELNPQQLGEDWPLLLEKICTQAFDECV